MVTEFLIFWLFHCLLVYTAYQTELVSFLADHGEDKFVTHSVELDELGFEIYTVVRTYGGFAGNEIVDNV